MESRRCLSSKIASRINYHCVFAGNYTFRSITYTQGKSLLVFLLICLFIGTSNAQQPQQANIVFELSATELRELAATRATNELIDIEVKNINRLSEGNRSFQLTIASELFGEQLSGGKV